ncbi:MULTISPECIES: transcriptional regulator [Vibrio]|uniref:Transcriptional regulator n=1 Tax=Vibrio casei TaxID=673372 RepID=A0A368LMV3_9VIBR|nr:MULTISPECIES: transcriptional regulator [Vibrio]RCS72843.1 transcriptional regulator [Vibrio casei]SJN38869.1 Transcriptional activator ToxR [Vibrio casei]HBV74854.1 transcriptional regulator [Vibrio sp.]
MTNIGTKYILANKFIFDPYSNTLIDQNDENEIVRLGSNESRILLILIESTNSVVSRDQLHEYVWRDQGFQVDDSSLTQAISTLRKMLQDSTKSPQFVKTVPKRGYQFIAQVEVAPPISSLEPILEESPQNTEKLHTTNQLIDDSSNAQTSEAKTEKNEVQRKEKAPLTIKFIWLIVILLPILAWMVNVPKSSDFTSLTTVDGIPVLVPTNQPELEQWIPIIKSCTKRYLSHSPGKTGLDRIIATGDQREKIFLNYIHSLDLSSENKTILLFVDQTNFDSLCQ